MKSLGPFSVRMNGLQFYMHFTVFQSYQEDAREGDNDRLQAIETCLQLKRFLPPIGWNPRLLDQQAGM